MKYESKKEYLNDDQIVIFNKKLDELREIDEFYQEELENVHFHPLDQKITETTKKLKFKAPFFIPKSVKLIQGGGEISTIC